jgi:3-hydroxybutyryl-CoA dehydrogenase
MMRRRSRIVVPARHGSSGGRAASSPTSYPRLVTDPKGIADAPATNPSTERIVGIVGAGIMGAGIAQVALEAGHEVVLHDVDAAAIARGRNRIADGLARRAARAVADPAAIDGSIDARMARLRSTEALEQLGDEADVVIEAALESLALKETIFRALDAVAPPTTILATNTSALPVGAIARATTRPFRVVGLHFFNPAPLMALVEVVAGPETDPGIATDAAALVTAWGKTAVRSADAPGFIVNRVNRPFTLGALRLLEDGAASIEAIDEAMRAAGFPLGPFELMDLTGIDVTFAASTAIWERLGRPDRLRPSPIQERLIAAGRLGRKTGEGFYRYDAGRRLGVGDHRGLAIERVADARDRADAPDPPAIRSTILAAIDAEARIALAEGVASEADIDLALRLGANHPSGPFERMRSGEA